MIKPKIRNRISGPVLITVSILLIVLSIYINQTVRNEFRSNIDRQLYQSCEIVSKEVQGFLSTYTIAVELMARDLTVVEYVNNVKEKGDKDREPIFSRVIQVMSDYKDAYDSIKVVWVNINAINEFQNHDANRIYTGDDYVYYERPWYKDMIAANGNAGVTGIYRAIYDQEEVVTVVAPVYAEEYTGNQVHDNVGAASIDISIREIRDYVESYKTVDGGFVAVIDKAGQFVCDEKYETALRYDEKIQTLAERTLGQSDQADGRKRASVIELEGIEYYYILMEMDIENWLVGAFVPVSEFDHIELFLNLSNLLIICAFIIVGFSFFDLIRLERQKVILENRNIRLDRSQAELEKRNEQISRYNQELIEKESIITEMAYHDLLTGIPNRRSYVQKVNESINSQRSFAVVMLDLDNFKEINDTRGHVFGDEILKQVAAFLEVSADDRTFVSRFGGDEFIILLQDYRDRNEIGEYAEAVLVGIEELFKAEDGINVTCSLGIALYPDDSRNVNELISYADIALYHAKRTGKNAILFFDRQLTEKLHEQMELVQILEEAIENDGFELYYQQINDAVTHDVYSFEALLRIKGRQVSPAIFIPIAEESGKIIKIGRWVVKEVCHFIKTNRNSLPKNTAVAINISPLQINDRCFVDYFASTLNQHGVEPASIHIEITEGLFMSDRSESIEFINDLRNLGVSIALDDFGTGYSSLNYLTYLTVDYIKLDRSLCIRFLNRDDYATMESLIEFSHSLGLKVIAEGIEESWQTELLEKIGCDYIQGYVFGKPLNESETLWKLSET